MKKEKLRVWSLTDIAVDEIVESHIEMVTEPQQRIIFLEETTSIEEMPPLGYELIKKAKPAPRKIILYIKYQFLIHIIIGKTYYTGKNGTIHLNSRVLREVLGDCIYDMLANLHKMGIIYISNTYEVGKSSRAIKLLDYHITHQDISNKKIIKYRKRLNEKLGLPVIEGYSQEFIFQYNKSLEKLGMVYKEEAYAYITNRNYESDYQRGYYFLRIHNFIDYKEQIHSVDKNNRIYHYMTNLPKDLKKFFNIKFQMDISNSHPLLYSSFLISHYNIDIKLLSILDTISIEDNADIDYSSNSYIHYESKELRKQLKIRELHVDIPSDVLVYIYLTMKGMFWDYFMRIYPDINRGEIKANLFKEIFYSYSTRINKKKCPYGSKFVELYPHVWSVLRMEKKKKNEELLPNRMMRLESSLFYEILSRCYMKGWMIINIHDAVVVLNVEENESCIPDKVKNIIKEVYHEKGLFPSVSVDTFTPHCGM